MKEIEAPPLQLMDIRRGLRSIVRAGIEEVAQNARGVMRSDRDADAVLTVQHQEGRWETRAGSDVLADSVESLISLTGRSDYESKGLNHKEGQEASRDG